MREKLQKSAVVTEDGFLDLPKDPTVAQNPEYGVYALQGHMVIDHVKDFNTIARAQELYRQGLLQVIGKSGGSRSGLEVVESPHESDAEFDFVNGRIVIPIDIMSLRSAQVRQNGRADQLLQRVIAMQKQRDLPIGRLAIAHPDDALSKKHILWAIRNHKLALGNGVDAKEVIRKDGLIRLPLEQLYYAFCDDNFDTTHQDNMLRFGKHGLADVQEERHGRPEHIEGRKFFVGGIKISLGPYIAIIDRETNEEGVVHLAARILDGIRTTGQDIPRQVELFNKLYKAVSTEDLTVNMRIYHADRRTQDFADRVINERTIHKGVSLSDVIQLRDHPERILQMMRMINPSMKDGNTAGYFVGPNRAHKVKWVQNASNNFQQRNIRIDAPKFSAADDKYRISGHEIPEPAAILARDIGYIGQDQSHQKMYFQWGFPDPDTIQSMQESGIGVFVAHDISVEDDAFEREEPYFHNMLRRTVIRQHPVTNEEMELPPANQPFFNSEQFHAMQALHSKHNVQFLRVCHETPDAFQEVDTIPERVMEWHDWGLWVKPEERERLEEVDTFIAMYGSHVSGTDAALEPQVARFMLRMKKLFGVRVGFMHGKGPGLMWMADKIARHLPEYATEEERASFAASPIISVGVGIDLEQQNQRLNHHPDAQIDFKAQHRLVRQKHMNDRQSFNVFNIGGAGTLEEIALSLCSQKLYKNLITPLIFVDEFGLSKDGNNFWLKLKEFLEDMSTKKIVKIQKPNGSEEDMEVTPEMASAASETIEIPVQLLQGHMKNCMHVVDNYDDAADIIEEFVTDPVGYYVNAGVCKEEFELAFSGATDVRKETHMPMPHWMSGAQYADMLSDQRWTAT